MSTISNIHQWLEASEPDYYMMFVKSFIPYNAWYMMNFYNEDENLTQDRAIIDYMKQAKPGENRYKERIVNLLKSNTPEAVSFKCHLAKLHFELRMHPIPNEEEAISFSQVYLLRNKVEDYQPLTIGKYTYSCRLDENKPKKYPRWILEIIDPSTTSTVGMVQLHKLKMAELVNNDNYIALPSDTMKEGVKKALNEKCEMKTVCLVLKECHGDDNVVADSFIIGEYDKVCLVNNTEQIAMAVMEIIYRLRCELFHGGLAPTREFRSIYEHAYYIQSLLIKKLL